MTKYFIIAYPEKKLVWKEPDILQQVEVINFFRTTSPRLLNDKIRWLKTHNILYNTLTVEGRNMRFR
jgi:hypothetical protein